MVSLFADDQYLVVMNVNTHHRTLVVPGHERLLTTLRERFHLFSPRYGCGTGHCGACVVLVNGEPVPSCLLLTVRQQNGVIETLEGVEDDAIMTRLMTAFAEEHAAQCGYCSPGLLLSARHLLKSCPNPTQSEIQTELSSHICRCTGYYAPLRAIIKVRDSHAMD
ncbi:MAG: 2Fe-2S iron-sulfur cluster-binding protein [Firmicutes bacterium]|nr:2Fe-2S iron-sulfur cluster-binding protein [Bacillota bacterium]